MLCCDICVYVYVRVCDEMCSLVAQNPNILNLKYFQKNIFKTNVILNIILQLKIDCNLYFSIDVLTDMMFSNHSFVIFSTELRLDQDSGHKVINTNEYKSKYQPTFLTQHLQKESQDSSRQFHDYKWTLSFMLHVQIPYFCEN